MDALPDNFEVVRRLNALQQPQRYAGRASRAGTRTAHRNKGGRETEPGAQSCGHSRHPAAQPRQSYPNAQAEHLFRAPSRRRSKATQAGDPMQLPARMKDVALAAGVSVATVSNVLHHPEIVAPSTREKVKVAIRALNYESGQRAAPPSAIKRGVQKPSTNPNAAPVTKRKRPVRSAAKPPAHITPYFSARQAAQVRAALQAAGAGEGYASLSDLVVAATMKEVQRLQDEYNYGRSWRGVPAGTIRRGRPTLGEVAARVDRP